MYKEMYIKERQNTEESIQYLRAQRYAYKRAKLYYITRMIFSVLWPITAVAMYFIFENKFANGILIISSLILVSTFLIELCEKKYTKIGATIQEQFDTNVFDMQWNYALVGDIISKEEIYNLAKKEKTDESKLINWYTGIDTNDEIQYTLKAQRTNTSWSIRQKTSFGNFLLIMFVIILMVLVKIAWANDFVIADFFITLFFPTISLFIYLLKGYVDFRQQVKELERITALIDDFLMEERITKDQLRSVQDAIYVYGRVPNNIIPDILYSRLRKELEETFENTNKSS